MIVQHFLLKGNITLTTLRVVLPTSCIPVCLYLQYYLYMYFRCHTPATYYGVSIRNATQTMSCDCVGEECVPHNGGSANVALAITLTVLFVLIAIAAVFGYRYYKRRQLLQKGTNIRYSSVYKDTVESNPHGPATLSSM